MIKTRRDAWTVKDDKILAETIIEHIESGLQQIRGFEEAGYKLGRTAAACGFRWNSVVRSVNEEEVEEARSIRRNYHNGKFASISIKEPAITFEEPVAPSISSIPSSDSIVVKYEQLIETIQEEKRQLVEYNRMLKQENDELKETQMSVIRILS